MSTTTLLLVDDEEDILDLLRETLEAEGYRCLTAASGAEALRILERKAVDLVLSDMRMPGMSGARLLEQAARLRPETVRMVLTGQADLGSAVDAINRGRVHAYMEKPWDSTELRRAVGEQVSEKRRREAQAQQAREHVRLVEAQRERAEQVFNAITTTTPDGVVMIDEAGRIVYWNQGARRIFGYRTDEALGKDFHALAVPERFHADFRCGFEQFQATGEGRVFGKTLEMTAQRRDGREFPAELTVGPLQVNGVWHSIGVVRDISDRVQAERNFKTMVTSTHTGIAIVDAAGLCLFANRSAQTLLGRSEQQLVGAPFGISLAERQDAEIEVLRPGGAAGIAELNVARLQWDGRPAWMAMLHDITKRKAAESKIREMAFHDALTELPNRTLFHDRLSQALKRARRGKQQVAVLFMDLDRFKPVNDSLGHSAGDRLLKEVARRLRDNLREVDTIARFGGDEFLILVANPVSEHAILSVAEKIRQNLNQPYYIDGEEIRITASIGVSVFPDDGIDPESLIRHADGALHRAKQSGRNTLQRYEDRFESRVPGLLRLEADLHKALEREEFVLYYQPQVNLATGRMIGAEALLRWNSRDKGIVPPGEFLPVLEESGMIHDVGDWVLRSACRQNRAWQAAGLAPVRMAVNLSGRQFTSTGIAEKVGMTLKDVGLAAEWLELEITETTLMRDIGMAKENLRALDAMGVSVALDDFGTGYSSLGYLNQLHCERLKIDRAFVRGLPDDRHGSAISSAVVAMSRALSFETVAEGVEEPEQLRFLSELGCNAIQGFLFSRPLPAGDIEGFLADNPPPRWVDLCAGRALATTGNATT